MFLIDPMSRTPIYEQLTTQVEKLVLCGALKPGEALPSVRAMSTTLSVNPNTVQRAYADLCQKGLVIAVPKKGCFIANQARERLTAKNDERLAAFADTVRELKLAGVDEDTLRSILHTAYTEGRDDDASHYGFA